MQPSDDHAAAAAAAPVKYLAHHGNVCDNSKFNVAVSLDYLSDASWVRILL